ncbi:MAG: hypothetical protein M3Q29_04685 [Chloroflexota bacterium]|nr:hypothetical protein [Chloroflexota bacterium]
MEQTYQPHIAQNILGELPTYTVMVVSQSSSLGLSIARELLAAEPVTSAL